MREGQRYPYKLNEQQTSKTIKSAVQPPEHHLLAIRAGTRMLGWDKYLILILSYRSEEKEHPTIYVKIAFWVGSPPKTPISTNSILFNYNSRQKSLKTPRRFTTVVYFKST